MPQTLDDLLIAGTSARALVERILVKKLLREREFNTPLANGAWALQQPVPTMSGNFVRFTRVNHIRRPQKAITDGSDPASAATLSFDRVETPVEFLQDFISLGQQARLMSWINLSNISMQELRIAVRRQVNNLIQDAFKVGRYQPFQYDAGGTAVPAERSTTEASPTINGTAFSFASAPTYFAALRGSFADLDSGDRHRMDLYRHVHTRLANSGAIKINGMYIAVISDAVKQDLMDDDKYFATAIRDGRMREALQENSLVDYGGFHWVVDDEPFTEQLGGSADVFVQNGNVHTSQVFGADAYGWVRVGGKNTLNPTFKVQDITATNSNLTIGYTVPFQTMILNNEWCANVVGPVSAAGTNTGS